MKKTDKLFSGKLVVINCGLRIFKKGIEESGGRCINMDWKPPAGGDDKLMDILEKMKRSEAEE